MLKDAPGGADVFNPYWQQDRQNEGCANAPEIRRRQLGSYLTERLGRVKYLMVGEALGYQGGHFSGIAMTSERLLLGGLTDRGVQPEHVFSSITPVRTSDPTIKPRGFTEPTATIVWSHFVSMKLDPREVIIWNAFPWHSFKPDRGMLSNRNPSDREIELGEPMLRRLIAITGIEHIVAVGNKAQHLLSVLGMDAPKVRHPANGGAPEFQRQFSAWIASCR